MNGEFVAFFISSLSAIIGGVLMLNLTKVMHMMLALVLTFLSIAGLYFLLSAEFVGVAQILLYSGAITIIMIFGIMLTKHNEENESRLTLRKWIIFFAVVAFGAVLYFAVNSIDFQIKAHKEVYLSMKITHFKSVHFSIQNILFHLN